MTGYLIGEEGLLTGLTLHFDNGTEWILGRDPDESTIALEDPSVSRKHAICRLTDEGIVLENLSSVNPCRHNEKVITEPILLKEGDILEIGGTHFRFSEKNPQEKEPELAHEDLHTDIHEEEKLETPEPALEEKITEFEAPSFARWLLKVISGPNAGAEFSLYPDTSYIIGKDPEVSDVVFYDLSVSRQHAKLTISAENHIFLEDLKSRNGTYVNGESLSERKELSSQDLIALGTTSFLVIDQEQIHETIISPPSLPNIQEKPLTENKEEIPKEEKEEEHQVAAKNWKETIIPVKHLVIAGAFCLCLLFIVTSTFSLFHTEPITLNVKHEADRVKEALVPFPSVQFSFNQASGKLFLIGHVLTVVEKQELSYALSTLPFIRSVEDTVIIDELVWQNMNALLLSNPDWQAIRIYASEPGNFILKGYVQTMDQFQQLTEYVNINFPYPNLLESKVAIEQNLQLQVQNLLAENDYLSVTFALVGGDLVLSGRVDDRDTSDFVSLIPRLQAIPGILSVKNFVVYSNIDSVRVDLSEQYNVSGFSIGSNNKLFVVINQKILGMGDSLNGMIITDIQPHTIFLEKDGIKFKINYNLQ
ncbi:MAG: type III secretion system inner membrane ring subunit SctD [Verrucomicrobia bacterium]|nr:type III secretion system inner membrane ring subunit SctD [Verrucomicrobiota bacterium]